MADEFDAVPDLPPDPPPGEPLGDADVRAIVRLLGRLSGMDGPAAGKRRALMDGLADLVGADGWLWTVTRVLAAENTPVSVGVIHGGLTDEQFAAWVDSSQVTDPPLPENEPLTRLVEAGRHFTRTREQVVSDASWYANPTVQKYRLGIGVDHWLYTIYPLPEPGVISAIGLFRKVGRPAFADRDRRITHILTSEIGWLHAAGVPTADGGRDAPQLTRRHRTVLVLLLDGHTRKDVARLLAISPHTAKDHIESVYRHFGVSSQTALMRRFAAGDGGDVAG